MKRVPLDFNWPINAIWQGYINPFARYAGLCAECGQTGYSKEAKELSDKWYGFVPFDPSETGSKPFETTNPVIQARSKSNCGHDPRYYGSGDLAVEREAKRLADLFNNAWCHHLDDEDVAALIAEGRLMDLTHNWDKEQRKWIPKDPPYVPTRDEVNQWSLSGLSHDSINAHVCIKAKCERLGIERECPACGGNGSIWYPKEMEQKYDEWTPEEPPVGEGFQLWETTTEGSPVSPVFKTLDELCEWAEPNANTFAYHKATAAEWKRMLEQDFVGHEEGNVVFL